MKVKLVVIRLKGRASAWWKQLRCLREKQGKTKITDWEKMKKKMKSYFLPFDYTQTVFQRYQTLRQDARSVNDPTKEFYQLIEGFGINHPTTYNFKRTPALQHLYVPPSSYDDEDNHEDEDLDNIEYDQSYSLDRPITRGDEDDDKIEIFGDPVYNDTDEEEIDLDEALIQDQKLTLFDSNQQHGSSIDEVRISIASPCIDSAAQFIQHEKNKTELIGDPIYDEVLYDDEFVNEDGDYVLQVLNTENSLNGDTVVGKELLCSSFVQNDDEVDEGVNKVGVDLQIQEEVQQPPRDLTELISEDLPPIPPLTRRLLIHQHLKIFYFEDTILNSRMSSFQLGSSDTGASNNMISLCLPIQLYSPLSCDEKKLRLSTSLLGFEEGRLRLPKRKMINPWPPDVIFVSRLIKISKAQQPINFINLVQDDLLPGRPPDTTLNSRTSFFQPGATDAGASKYFYY